MEQKETWKHLCCQITIKGKLKKMLACQAKGANGLRVTCLCVFAGVSAFVFVCLCTRTGGYVCVSVFVSLCGQLASLIHMTELTKIKWVQNCFGRQLAVSSDTWSLHHLWTICLVSSNMLTQIKSENNCYFSQLEVPASIVSSVIKKDFILFYSEWGEKILPKCLSFTTFSNLC